MHLYGRVWTAICLFLMLCVPLFIGLYFKAAPSLNGVLMGAFGVCLIFLPSSIVEVITYAPMMGTGATYLAFVTGNLSNLKIPCCMNARDIAGTEYGTRENEIGGGLRAGDLCGVDDRRIGSDSFNADFVRTGTETRL